MPPAQFLLVALLITGCAASAAPQGPTPAPAQASAPPAAPTPPNSVPAKMDPSIAEAADPSVPAEANPPCQETNASILDQAAQASFKAGDFTGAARAYECAYSVEPKVERLFNLASALEQTEGRCVAAAAAFRRFVEACGACVHRQAAELRLWKLEAKCPESMVVQKDGLLLSSAVVEVEGWGTVRDGDEATARREAERDAERQAVETAAGVHIKTMMTDQSISELRDNAEKFVQEVRTRLESRAEGFVERREVLRHWRDGATFKVVMRVRVQNRALLREIVLLARQLRWARFPKVMFLVKEEYTDQQGKVTPVEEPTLQAILEGEFLARGFDLVDQAHVEKLRREEAQVFSDIIDDNNKAAKFAMERGAEYVVTGVARIRHTSFNDLHQGEHHGLAELSVRALDVSTAAVVASSKESGPSPGNCFSEADLRIRAVSRVAPGSVQGLLKSITSWWDESLRNGVPYSVKIYGIKSYRNEATKAIDLLRKIPGTKDVKERSFGGERLELDLRYTAAYGVEQLKLQILEAAARQKVFADLDVEYSSGRELNFRMRPGKGR
ncbi:MAG: hypothetical protein IPG45_33715 [Deltaproteobacteria bacterium]|nr:hypothetical protein [Deltaproteobacteria bacterium]